ncbi:MAG: hypothetical protein VKK04_19790 [Synechococcales bacterium]|nr:hypothetical protein [Synechococcales bacterium]
MAAFFRQYVAPLLIVLVFLVAMVAVSARIFLPNDLAAPAPIEDPDQQAQIPSTLAIASPSWVTF